MSNKYIRKGKKKPEKVIPDFSSKDEIDRAPSDNPMLLWSGFNHSVAKDEEEVDGE